MARKLQGCSGWQKYYVSKYQKKTFFFCSNSVNPKKIFATVLSNYEEDKRKFTYSHFMNS